MSATFDTIDFKVFTRRYLDAYMSENILFPDPHQNIVTFEA